ncbi:unnamed protein product [Rodentolepis nana]|uniref:G_PROTEIN_RECEP_F1_2 domain-containing protein n=1 Tax=Rodentolepis nana TaxID=102285 RepID=A0A0R3T1Z9_RODNA|nr:unnamed protein product [Rodentolepis nana]
MIALSATDALTLIITFPLGFQRCKGFLKVCPKPWFKTLRLWISYYTTYFHFPISNSSETASILLTLFLSIERYVAMHKLSCKKIWRPRVNLKKLLCCSRKLGLQTYESSSNSCCLKITMTYPTSNGTRKNNDFNIKWKLDFTEFGKSQTYSVYTWLRSIFVYIIPLLLLCIFNFYLVKFVRTANSRWRLSKRNPKPPTFSPDAVPESTVFKTGIGVISGASFRRNERRQAAQRKLTILSVAIAGSFMAGQMPQALAYASNYQIFHGLFGGCRSSLGCCPPYRIYRAVTNCVCLITYSTNFFLYATLIRHFKHQLMKQFGIGIRKKRITSVARYEITPKLDKNSCKRKQETTDVIRVPLSVDTCQSGGKTLSASEAVLPTETNKLLNNSDSHSYEDHVWKVNIRVSPEEGERSVTLPSATPKRTICATHSHSISLQRPKRSLSESFSSQLKFPAPAFLFSSEPLRLNSILKLSGINN